MISERKYVHLKQLPNSVGNSFLGVIYDGTMKTAVVDRASFKPYFFVKEKDYQETIATIGAVECDYGNYETVDHSKAVKLSFKSTDAMKKAMRRLEEKIDTFEGDLFFTRRVQIDEGITFEDYDKILYWDIEVDSRERLPNPDAPHQQIIHIGCLDYTGEYFDFCYDDERQMIKEFYNHQLKYKATAGWFTAGFDLPYLINRASMLGIRLDITLFSDFDCLKIYRRFYKKSQESYSLSSVVKKACGYEIEDWGNEGTVSQMWELYLHDRKKLIGYTAKQLKAVKDINEKTGLIDRWCFVCKKANVLPYAKLKPGKMSELPGNSFIIDNLILKKSLELGKTGRRVVWKSKPYIEGALNEEHNYIGGYVKDPAPGLWNNVIDIDAAQQYPAVIKTFNIGLETFCEEKQPENIQAYHGSFLQEPKSILSQVVKTLSDERYKAKRERNKFHPSSADYYILDNAQKGLKYITNSVYGICGFPGSRYFRREIAENITTYAREILQGAIGFLSDRFTALYGDTDSVFMFPKFEYADLDELIERTDACLKELNTWVISMIQEKWNVPKEKIEILFQYDTVFGKLYLTSKKKCYAGLVVWQNEGKIEPYIHVKGFETVRTSTLQFARELQWKIFEAVLRGITIGTIARDLPRVRDEFMEGKYDERLFYRIGLNREPENYASETATVKAYKQLLSEGKSVRVGDKMSYVRGAGGRIITKKADFLREDRRMIWDSYVQPMLDRLEISTTKQEVLF